MDIEWDGRFVGRLEDSQSETLALPSFKVRGRWAPRRTRKAREFSRILEEQSHVEVAVRGLHPVCGQKVLFSFGLEEEAWLFFYVYDLNAYWKGVMEVAKSPSV